MKKQVIVEDVYIWYYTNFYNNWTFCCFIDEIELTEVGLLNAGDMFGEIALLHKVPRSATVITKSNKKNIWLRWL